MSPTLKWEKQFIIIVDKIREAIANLKSISLLIVNTYIYYNTYLMKEVYFVCSIIKLLPI